MPVLVPVGAFVVGHRSPYLLRYMLVSLSHVVVGPVVLAFAVAVVVSVSALAVLILALALAILALALALAVLILAPPSSPMSWSTPVGPSRRPHGPSWFLPLPLLSRSSSWSLSVSLLLPLRSSLSVWPSRSFSSSVVSGWLLPSSD
ncbi:hypothetical protein CVT25_007975 [Psilocybe cyanescens]|uniref:Uncharacterized protein n=1 Tax=Psilocybe cyanescens TaxID=93625 RepID=A0A409XMV3_PSICY|nr:hypothetical protein CVT25_007975 [Psilocybe cyanescens]